MIYLNKALLYRWHGSLCCLEWAVRLHCWGHCILLTSSHLRRSEPLCGLWNVRIRGEHLAIRKFCSYQEDLKWLLQNGIASTLSATSSRLVWITNLPTSSFKALAGRNTVTIASYRPPSLFAPTWSRCTPSGHHEDSWLQSCRCNLADDHCLWCAMIQTVD